MCACVCVCFHLSMGNEDMQNEPEIMIPQGYPE